MVDSLLRRQKRAPFPNITVRRKGLKAKEWYSEHPAISVRGADGKTLDELTIHFAIPAGGQGDTMVQVAIKADDFPTLLALMSATDRDATLRAMAEEMHYQLCGKSK